jgi:NADH-quinone oxidoreductase subunit N
LSAPLIWIVIPAAFAVILWFIPHQRLVTILGIGISLLLALAAWQLPLETPLKIGNWSIKVSSTLSILGRHFILEPTDLPLLTFFFISLCFWFICSRVAGSSFKLISYGLIIIALLIAALAVEPFLYAALLIEIAVLISIPFLKPSQHRPGRGLLRYLTFQTIAMPFILFSGWLLTEVNTNQADISLVYQAAIFLGLGFIFLLAIFPFHTWIPLLSEETHPSTMAFILWIFPTIGLFFGLKFMDIFSWIRDSDALVIILRTTGMIMIISGGIWAAFQTNLKRMLAYALIMETGYSLLSISISGIVGVRIFFGLMIPRMLALFLWSMALTILIGSRSTSQFSSVKGLGRKYPFAAALLFASHLSLAGVPLLAGFPIHQALWEQLGLVSITGAVWYFLATAGIIMGGIRSMAVLILPSDKEAFTTNENWNQRIFLSFGMLILLLCGIFPQVISQWISQLPSIFVHLGK